MLSNKENYMKVMNREIPESIPTSCFTMMPVSVLMKDRNPDLSGFDYLGVEYVVSEKSGFAFGFIPKPGVFMIDDITKWRDIVRFPDLSYVDWEKMANDDLKKYDRSRTVLLSDAITGFFQGLINYMGFTEGLLACYEEPEEVKALMDTLCTFHEGVAKKIIKYYKPDGIWLPDDICTARAPFVSKEMFEDLFMPYWKRIVDLYRDAGLPAQLHCCGEAGILIDDFVKCGFSCWDPAQPQNDLVGIKARHGKNFAFVGGFDTKRIMKPDMTEEEVRYEIRNFLETFAPGGGLIWTGGMFMNPSMKEKGEWVRDEFNRIATNYYVK